jgi:hypothetical protein
MEQVDRAPQVSKLQHVDVVELLDRGDASSDAKLRVAREGVVDGERDCAAGSHPGRRPEQLEAVAARAVQVKNRRDGTLAGRNDEIAGHASAVHARIRDVVDRDGVGPVDDPTVAEIDPRGSTATRDGRERQTKTDSAERSDSKTTSRTSPRSSPSACSGNGTSECSASRSRSCRYSIDRPRKASFAVAA